MTSIIVAAPPIPGETAPVLQLAAHLVERGHRVTALLGSGYADAARRTGARFVPLTGEADFDITEIASRPERLGLTPGPDQLNWDHSEIFVRPVPAQHRALQDLLEEEPDAVLLCNWVFLGAWPVALGAPGRRPRRWVAVVASPLVLGDDATTPFGPVPGLSGTELVEANRAANEGFEASMQPTRRALQETVDALGATATVPAYVDGLYTVPDATVALTVEAFDFPRSGRPASLHYGGVLPVLSPGDDPTPSWWPELTSRDPDVPVVVVTQGTVANSDLAELVVPTLEALADRELLVVATLGRDASALAITPPANARVESWVPYDTLLPHADVLVTNGGFGGVQQALAHGVPVIVAGTTEDKPMVGAHVTFHGVGLDLGTQTPTAEQVGSAVAAVLDEPGYRAAAQRVGTAFHAADPVSTVETLLV